MSWSGGEMKNMDGVRFEGRGRGEGGGGRKGGMEERGKEGNLSFLFLFFSSPYGRADGRQHISFYIALHCIALIALD